MGVLRAQNLSSLSNSFSEGETPGPRIPLGRAALAHLRDVFLRTLRSFLRLFSYPLVVFLVLVPSSRFSLFSHPLVVLLVLVASSRFFVILIPPMRFLFPNP